MPDANEVRRRRHDTCKRLVTCPRCEAEPGEACRTEDYIGSTELLEQARTLGRSTGKTVVSTHVFTHQMVKAAYCRQHIGGLHQERWRGMENLDAVTRLALLSE